jgi:hypothetical protein
MADENGNPAYAVAVPGGGTAGQVATWQEDNSIGWAPAFDAGAGVWTMLAELTSPSEFWPSIGGGLVAASKGNAAGAFAVYSAGVVVSQLEINVDASTTLHAELVWVVVTNADGTEVLALENISPIDLSLGTHIFAAADFGADLTTGSDLTFSGSPGQISSAAGGVYQVSVGAVLV